MGAAPTVNYVKYVKITIQQVAQPDPLLPQPPLDFKNFESLQNGAAVFIKNGELNVNDMVIDLVDSEKDGGFIYSDGLVEIKISNSKFSNLQADRGGFIYSNGDPLLVPLSPAFL